MSTEVITLNVFTLHTVNNPSWKYLTVANSCHVSKMNKMYQQISVHIGWACMKIIPILYGKCTIICPAWYIWHTLYGISLKRCIYFVFFMGTKINKLVRYNINKNQMHTWSIALKLSYAYGRFIWGISKYESNTAERNDLFLMDL